MHPCTMLLNFSHEAVVDDDAVKKALASGRLKWYGTDFPSPGVPDIKKNLDQVRALPLSEATKEKILSTNALAMWPA